MFLLLNDSSAMKLMTVVSKKLVGRCGLYCGACPIYRAFKDSEKLRQKIAVEENRSPEEIRCEGCQTVLTKGWNSRESWGRNCGIVKCLQSKKLNFCYECDVYPNCQKFRRVADFSSERDENLVDNLDKIRQGKVEEWLKEEDKKWKCDKCHRPVSMYLEECHWCGAKINKR